jgi:hypothetical protein
LNKTSRNNLFNVYSKIGKNTKSSLDKFCNYLQNTTYNFTDEQKVYFTYYWIAHNIQYDVANYYSRKRSSDISPSSIFENKATEGSGYSKLFTQLLKCTNYQEEKIHNIVGYGKSAINLVNNSNENNININEPNHEWNLVEIGNKSCLIDVTWGAGITTSKHDFVKKYDEFYLCTPPEIFIRNHLPQESQSDMQGIEPKVSFDEFINMSETLKSFYKLGYTAVTPDLKNLNICGAGKITLNYKSEERPVLLTKLLKNGKEIENSYINNKNGKEYNVNFYINEEGNYTLDLYSNTRVYEYSPLIVSFDIKCRESPNEKKYYPFFYFNYETKDVELISPLDKDLVSGNKYNFEFKSPDEKIILSYNGLIKEMDKNGTIFTLNDILIEGAS